MSKMSHSGQMPEKEHPRKMPQAHFNPNFKKNTMTSNVHLNPNFKPQPQKPTPKPHLNPVKAHVNPNFTNRPLPPTPKSGAHFNPKFMNPNNQLRLDEQKQAAYHNQVSEAVATQSKSANIFFNPNFKKCNNVSSVTPTYVDPDSVRLNKRLKTTSSLNEKENNVPKSSAEDKNTMALFKKIGNKKLIRIKQQINRRKSSSPQSLYRLKTPRKIIKTTPRRKSLILRLVTPLSLKKRRWLRDTNISKNSNNTSITPNRFKIDRRLPEVQEASKSKQKSVAPPKPVRSKSSVKDTIVNVQGVKFKVSDQGRKLCRVTSDENTPKVPSKMNRKLFLEGEEFVEKEPGVLVLSRNSMTRQSITNARNKSINTILKSQMRSKQYCMFFNKFGKCTKRDKGRCPYIHDPEKIAVCRRFLRGDCNKENCLLSHKVAPEKMPTCKFFIESICTRENCPYRHVKVNPEAQICPAYLKGFCPAGSDCKKRHVSRCPQFERTGVCPRGKTCQFPHKVKNKDLKKSPPAKPKRKSVPKPTPIKENSADIEVDSRKAGIRYFDHGENEASDAELEENKSEVLNEMSGGARPQLGELPAFIPLEMGEEEEKEDDEVDERLI